MPATRPRLFAVVCAAAASAALLLGGCAPSGDDSVQITGQVVSTNPELATDPDVPVVEDIAYGTAGGQTLLLDACLPPGDTDPSDADVVDPGVDSDPAVGTERPRPAIVVVHGGSWVRGDKADIAWRAVCQWLASEGYPTFAVNYRLAPQFPFPAAFDDVQTAVRWLRADAQVARFDIDPDRIGAFGGSAGGNLAALLGTSGSGDKTVGARVAAVVDLSGPIDLTGVATTDDFAPVQLAYLGCASADACPAARAASPNLFVDPTDPPFFVGHSTEEKILLAQSELFVTALRGAGIDTRFITVDGPLHSIAMIDADLKDRIVDFLDETLAGPAIPVADTSQTATAAG